MLLISALALRAIMSILRCVGTSKFAPSRGANNHRLCEAGLTADFARRHNHYNAPACIFNDRKLGVRASNISMFIRLRPRH